MLAQANLAKPVAVCPVETTVSNDPGLLMIVC
jgi:hypothetical protein